MLIYPVVVQTRYRRRNTNDPRRPSDLREEVARISRYSENRWHPGRGVSKDSAYRLLTFPVDLFCGEEADPILPGSFLAKAPKNQCL